MPCPAWTPSRGPLARCGSEARGLQDAGGEYSPCPLLCAPPAPAPTPSAGRSGATGESPQISAVPARSCSPRTWGPPRARPRLLHLVCGELHGGACAWGPVLAPVGPVVEVGGGYPEFVGGLSQRWEATAGLPDAPAHLHRAPRPSCPRCRPAPMPLSCPAAQGLREKGAGLHRAGAGGGA